MVSVTIQDTNDNPPKFDPNEYTVSILENSPKDQLVLHINVTDPDLVLFLKSSLSVSTNKIKLRKDLTK